MDKPLESDSVFHIISSGSMNLEEVIGEIMQNVGRTHERRKKRNQYLPVPDDKFENAKFENEGSHLLLEREMY